MISLKKLILLGTLGLLLVGCGRSKIKTYTLTEKDTYLEKANSGDKEARQFIVERMNEAEKIYKETAGDETAYNEWQQWMKVYHGLRK